MTPTKNQSRVIRLVRAVSFSSAHRYFDQAMSESENQDAYGSLYRKKGFGHNFRVEAHFQGAVDPLTGMIVNLIKIDGWLNEVVQIFDHRHLNELSVFSGRAPTPERIAQSFFAELEKQLRISHATVQLAKVRLYEGDELWIDCFS